MKLVLDPYLVNYMNIDPKFRARSSVGFRLNNLTMNSGQITPHN